MEELEVIEGTVGRAAPARERMLLSAEEAAPIIGISRDKLRACMHDQRLPLPHVEIGSVCKVNMSLVQDWLDVQTVGYAELCRALSAQRGA